MGEKLVRYDPSLTSQVGATTRRMESVIQYTIAAITKYSPGALCSGSRMSDP
jgi:hypothetical protein